MKSIVYEVYVGIHEHLCIQEYISLNEKSSKQKSLEIETKETIEVVGDKKLHYYDENDLSKNRQYSKITDTEE